MEATVEQRQEKPLDVRNKVSKNMSTNPSQSIKSHLLRIPEAAEYLNSTVWFVRSLVWGGFPHLRLGKRILLDRTDLDSFIGQQKMSRGDA